MVERDNGENRVLGNRTEKIKNWLKKPSNFAITALVALVLVYRIYWFFKVGNQPLWFDEAEYLITAKSWLGIGYWATNPIRPILFTMIAYFFFLAGFGESALRIFTILVSTACIPLIYLIAKRFFDEKVALFSAAILALFWSFTFYTYRLLVDIPVAFLWLMTIWLFFRAYFGDKNWKHFALAGMFLGLSFLMKFSTVALIAIMLIYIVTTEKFRIFVNGRIWAFFIASLIAVIPYFIWQKIKFGSFLAFYTAAAPSGGATRSFMQSLFDQTLFSFGLLKWMLLVLVLIGAIYFILKYLFLFDKTFVKNSSTNKIYFVLLWIVASLIFFGWLNYGDYMDERYYFVFYPALFILAAGGLGLIYSSIRKYSKYIAIFAVIVLIAIAGYQNLSQAGDTINIKKDSYVQLKEAGLWIKQSTIAGDKIVANQETPELQYYSERDMKATGDFNSSAGMKEFIKDNNVKYVILVLYYPQNMKQWEMEYFSGNDALEPVKSYTPYVDKDQKLPLVTIFRIKENYNLTVSSLLE